MKLSANLGFLWPELELLDAIDAAARSGFSAVEFHWPYVTHSIDVALAAETLGIDIVCLNTVGGDLANREFGLAALAGRFDDARSAVDKALAYAADVSASYINVLAGTAEGRAADEAYRQTLTYAVERAETYDIGVLIEPLNPHDNPGYYLHHVDQAAEVIEAMGSDRLRLLLDCYHAARVGDDVVKLIARHGPLIGHVQIASVPDRREPDHGVVDYRRVVEALGAGGYDGYVAGEYQPRSTTEAGLGWMSLLASA